eukprot:TRINITY_DN30075_c0_g2_i1.p1 TRINITY_DN30075_c0_g2~~TRINITY_DN30075_c0_g2_i1.p1  ORF type:complete len:598 (+),score=150.50 TRINITY_DN30075_c0_g2_i1:175-1968(+)
MALKGLLGLQVGVLILLAQTLTALPILPDGLYCENASYQFELSSQDKSLIQGGAFCDDRPLGEIAACCQAEELLEVLQELEHSQHFLLRNLEDRDMFIQQYSQVNFGQHPCGDAGKVMLDARLERLQAYQQTSKMIFEVLGTTVRHMLCMACDAGPSKDPAQNIAKEAAFADAWLKISQQAEQLYRGLRAHDAAVGVELKQGELAPCALEFVEALRRGVAAPAAHRLPLRPWQARVGKQEVHRIHTFAEVWKRWIESLASLSSEFAEGLQHETEGIILGLGQTLQDDSSIGRQLLVAPPPAKEGTAAPATGGPFGSFATVPSVAKRAPLSPPTPAHASALSASAAASRLRAVLLVAMPNAGTDLRFDFANDPLTLTDGQLSEHAAAVEKATAIAGVRVVVVSSNPDQAEKLAARFSSCQHDIHVIWRRYALFSADALASLYAEQPPPRDCNGAVDVSASRTLSRSPSTAILVFEVRPGGSPQELSAAVDTLATGRGVLPAAWQWPTGLRPALSYLRAWPSKVAAAEAAPMLLASRTSPAAASGASCPAFVQLLGDYLRFQREVRARLRQQEEQGGISEAADVRRHLTRAFATPWKNQ